MLDTRQVEGTATLNKTQLLAYMIRRMLPPRSSGSDVMQSRGPRARSVERSLWDETLQLEKCMDDSNTASTESDDESHGGAPLLHRRAMSDPIHVTEEQKHDKHSLFQKTFQTMPRYPVGESHDMNCWSEPDEKIFQVRGSSYLQDGRKITSGPYLMRARGADLLLVDEGDFPPQNIGRCSAVLGGSLRNLPTFIFNLRFHWGIIALYWEIPTNLCPYLRPAPHPPLTDDMSTPEKTLAKFFMGDDDHKNRSLKLIPYIPGGPFIARNLVTGRPTIIGTKLPVTYTYTRASNGLAEYLEADLDIGSSSNTAKRIVSVCRRYMNALTVDIGLVIQGNCEEELPEQMLGSIRLHGPDPGKAPMFG